MPELKVAGEPPSGEGLASYVFSPTKQNWQILNYQPNDAVGFSATLFGRGDEKILAIRGSEFGNGQTYDDLIKADLKEIGYYGIAVSQLVSLYNYVNLLQAKEGATGILQLTYRQSETQPGTLHYLHDATLNTPDAKPYHWFETAYDGIGLGGLGAGDSVALTGHSLGGHLAAALLRLKPDLFDQAVTFNAPGFDPPIGLIDSGAAAPGKRWTDEFMHLFAQAGANPAPGFAALADRIHTIESESSRPGDDWSLVSSTTVTGMPPSPERYLTTEKNSHSMDQMVDALALQSLVAGLNPDLRLSDMSNLIWLSSAQAGASEERLVERLSQLLLNETLELPRGEAPGLTSLWSAPPPFAARVPLHEQILDLREAVQGRGDLRLLPLRVGDASLLLAGALAPGEAGLAARYALTRLDPFLIEGDAALYQPHNAAGELALFDPAAGSGSLTGAYLSARAEMLDLQSLLNLIDLESARVSTMRSRTFIEYAAPGEESLRLAEQTPSDPLRTAYTVQFGGVAADSLAGGEGNDALFGSAGDDLLSGGGGDDYLEGGIGDDRYRYRGGDGFDRLLDVDGRGMVEIDGRPLDGGHSIGDRLYRSADGRVTYLLLDAGSGAAALLVNDALRLEAFTPGDLGISFAGFLEAGPAPAVGLDGTPGDDLDLGVGADGTVRGSDAAELIRGLGGSDSLLGGGGDDWLEGGSADDILVGGSGADQLHAGARAEHSAIVAAGERAAAPGHDWLSGGEGSDRLTGSEGSDVLNGGGDGDLIWGGAGNDYIAGDSERRPLDADWAARWENEAVLYAQGILNPESAGDDTIIAGAGNDSVWGQGGDDTVVGGFGDDQLSGDLLGSEMLPLHLHGDDLLDGGAGNDGLSGDGGNDLLFGGAGNDRLHGDFVSLVDAGGTLRYAPWFHGDDRLFGDAGEDTLTGGAGRDTLFGGSGVDHLYGDDESSGLDVTLHGDDDLSGGADDDLLFGNGGDDILRGDAGNDHIWGGAGRDLLQGGLGNDYLVGDNAGVDAALYAADEIHGGEGADTLYGLGGNDTLSGGAGDDLIHAGPGRDRIHAGSGNDLLFSGEGGDHFQFYYGDGVDVLRDPDADDWVELPRLERIQSKLVSDSAGGHYLELGYGEGDRLLIEGGLTTPIRHFVGMDSGEFDLKELLQESLFSAVSYQMQAPGEGYGGRFDDLIVGSAGNDRIDGQAGADTLAGGAGDDWLAGGPGEDRYIVGVGTGRDRIDEAEGAVSQLTLTAGVSVADLGFHREGDSLLLSWRGAGDGVEIVDFYQRDQHWEISDSDGGSVVVAQEQVDLPPLPQAGMTPLALWEAYPQQLSLAFGGALRAQGYRAPQENLYTRTFTQETQKNSYRVRLMQPDAAQVSGESDRQLPDRSWTLLASRQIVVSEPWYDTLGSRFVAGSWFGGGDYVDLAAGASGVRLGLNRLPQYGLDDYTDPLTGEVGKTVVGYWVFPDDAALPGLISRQRTYTEWEIAIDVNLATLIGSEGDDRIDLADSRFNRVDGGDGDDLLDASASSAGVPVPGVATAAGGVPGALLYGNAGDDRLYGGAAGDWLIGGSGRDQLIGGAGGDSYYLFDTQGGDLIFDWGALDGIGSGQDRVFLPAGVAFDQLTLALGTTVAAESFLWPHSAGMRHPVQSVHTTLQIGWQGSEGVMLILPHSERGAGTGVDLLLTDTGERRTLTDLLDGEGLSWDPDPHELANQLSGAGVLSGGAGDDLILADPHAYAGGFGGPGGGAESLLIGGAGNDSLQGAEGANLLLGGELIEDYSWDLQRFIGSYYDAGNTFRGGPGHDQIWATAGADIFEFDLGDGYDLINDLLHYRYTPFGELRHYPRGGAPYDAGQLNQVQDLLRFGASIAAREIQVERVGNDLVFAHANGVDAVNFAGWFGSDVNQLQRVEFADGAFWGRDEIERLLRGEPLNSAPTVAQPPPDRQLREAEAFTFELPATLFNDPDGDPLSLNATLADGDALPGWLQFDPSAAAFSGLPTLETAGVYRILLAATDPEGLAAKTGFDLSVEDANPPLSGHDGDDLLTGSDHPETLEGGAGSDLLLAGGGDDTLSGGSGSDLLDGGAGDDLLLYSGDGSWSGYVYAYHAGSPGHAGLRQWHRVAGYQESRDVFRGGPGEDTLRGSPGDDALFLDNGLSLFPQSPEARISGIEVIETGAGNDVVDLTSYDFALGDLRVYGGDGDDLLWSSSGDDLLMGGAGDDQLAGGWGADTLDGGSGDDRLNGGWGNDVYRFDAGAGDDRIFERQGEDRLEFGAGFDAGQLWLQRDGQDLLITALDGEERLTIDRWYRGDAYRVEELALEDGRVLLAGEVQQLVDAMAQFDPPASGALAAGAEITDQLQPLIASVWRPAA